MEISSAKFCYFGSVPLRSNSEFTVFTDKVGSLLIHHQPPCCSAFDVESTSINVSMDRAA